MTLILLLILLNSTIHFLMLQKKEDTSGEIASLILVQILFKLYSLG